MTQYAQAAYPDQQYHQDFAISIAASRSKPPSPVLKSAVAQFRQPVPHAGTPTTIPKMDLSLNAAQVLSRDDLTYGSHNFTSIFFVFNAEIASMTGNEVVRLAQLSPKFSDIVLDGPCDKAVFVSNIQIIPDRLITGSAFLFMKDLALFNSTARLEKSKVYSKFFNEGQDAFLAAVLHANVVFGPFPNVDEYCLSTIASTDKRKATPMPHVFKMQMPFLDHDAHVRDESFDSQGRYEFFNVLNTHINLDMYTDLIQKDWVYIGPRIYHVKSDSEEEGYSLVFRKPRAPTYTNGVHGA